MRAHLLVISLLMLNVAAIAAQDSQPAADKVVASLNARDTARDAASGGYSGSREYVLENHRLHKSAQMLVRVTCDKTGTKHFEVMSETGWKAANKHVLHQMLVAESGSSRPEMRPRNRITAANYSFRMIGTEPLNGRKAYVIEAKPKREDKLLFRGRIWVDTEDYALVRVEGEPAKNPSFWTRKVHFIQEYSKAGAYWFPAETTSVTEAWIFGTTEVSIRYFNYKPAVTAPDPVPDYTLSEARYATR